jgi:UDP-N-acetylglucosamine 3-dehydrogenase
LRAELQAFVAAVRNGTEPAITGEEGVAGLEIAIRCLQERAQPTAAPRRAGPRRATG